MLGPATWGVKLRRTIMQRMFNFGKLQSFEDQAAAGMMVKTAYAEAQRLYGDRLRVAALGAVPQDGGYRIIHDVTHKLTWASTRASEFEIKKQPPRTRT